MKKNEKLNLKMEKIHDLEDIQLDQVIGGKKTKTKEPEPPLPASFPDFTTCHATGDAYTCYSCMTC